MYEMNNFPKSRFLLCIPWCLFWVYSPSSAAFLVSSTHSNGRNHYNVWNFQSKQHNQEQERELISNESKECPYSMRFAPQRIDLTRPQQSPSNSFWWSSFIPGRQQRFERSIICDRVEWYDQTDGLALLGRVFQIAATATEETLTLAFPDAKSSTLLHHAVEILMPYAMQWDVQMIWEPLPHIFLTKKANTETIMNTLNTHENAAWIDTETHKHRTRAWVQRLLVTHGICPYTRSDTRSGQGIPGVPAAPIAYSATPANNLLSLVAVALETIQRDMLDVGPEQTSSILLAAPAFDNRFEEWSGPFFAMLQACIVAVSLEDTIGVVCFHPEYKVPDGQTFAGFGQMHSVPRLQQLTDIASWDEAAAGGAWQRRTPHSTLNVLWAPQLALAEKQRKTATLYRENIRKIVHGIGTDRLQEDLQREKQLL